MMTPSTPVRRLLARCVISMISACAAASAQAQSRSPAASAAAGTTALPPVVSVSPAARPGSRIVSMTLKQLGADQPLQLRGVDGINGVPFSVRADEVVTGARLKLRYSYSPALLPQLSHINVMINGEVAQTVPVPREQGGSLLEKELILEPRLITEFNRLNLQLIGHYTADCEDPFHSSLWATVSNASVLELTVTRGALANDLALLPLPFFDRRDIGRLRLPFIFAGSPSAATLEAAGAVSSWFGGLAGYRGASFPVTLNELPGSGNGVVFATQQERPAGIGLPQLDGPTVAIVPNPNDAGSKLLLVMGRDSAELKTAARALALGAKALSGQRATITGLHNVAPRKPYDAPNWLRSDRPVRFGELIPGEQLNVSGYQPDLVRVSFRLPPDLFGWRSRGIPIDLRYRYTPRPTQDKSTLNINVNSQFLRAYPLRSLKDSGGKVSELVARVLPDGSVPQQQTLHLPLFMVPAQSQLQFHYYYDYPKQGACKDTLVDNIKGAIDPDSTIDISSLPHFMALPDLAAFGNSGFPFTRMADLSETAVVLPSQPSAEDYSTYLTVMGRMGESTGHPASGVKIIAPADVQQAADRDLLVIGTAQNQPLLSQWADHIPVSLAREGKHFTLTEVYSDLLGWWNGADGNRNRPVEASLSISSPGTDAALAGFESPLAAGRSVVAITSDTPGGLLTATDMLLDADRLPKVQGSLVLVRGTAVSSLAAQQSYYVGRLDPWTYVHWWLSQRPYAMVLMLLIATPLLGATLFLMLRGRAKRRKAGQA
ncbi:cellulose biosynthesis cyclic di-GMP-binding regulatory protein BcsB [Cupriavidus sp. WKF15]|uniref:cellulose biosynthesis cyclic di-GMP-binding regulatory protein BcsB n=1 Tax=Cupriavidus sp. WKF15 TaxID=3032282 RepID=UPI0023E2DB48|nr:cellulose biosynthesis cyclic di-GMP-binding regulatory protein BcsB [Cupriavidus sp. WKF15]WER47317.1 cellulose biosynthesis cyclic di-GMP-binding regulatory protein BcsB [Cupriavidus sp. WKF15]